MLVLSRKPRESIILQPPGYPPITVCVVEIRDGKARIGIEAPREIAVHREEMYEAIRREAQRQEVIP